MSNSFDDLDDGRPESPAQRADRNWNEILQELRVLQTGTQILTGFLLALAFQAAFTELDAAQRVFYLVLVCLAALSAVVALAPVALHRAVFHLQVKPALVRVGHNALRAALALVSLLLVGVVMFVFDVVVGLAVGVIAGVVLGAVILVLWVMVPVSIRRRGRESRR
ncbi:DUF6328 family protein [Microbacterium testaceum]|uniref:DUF6328 family protein n=1 Tax=Microbacterium testaceum TaxID=2033 RepID=UPI0012ACB857|nr:DUF6328 family protein [Microbacterium testaceum]